MSILLLTEDDVRRLLTMDEAIEAVEEVLRQLALDEAQNVPRARCQTDQAMLHVMAGAAPRLGVLGCKVYGTSRHGANFHVGLFDGATGALLALIQADYLGRVRTGAASGVAAQCLARPEATEVGLFGSGKQARTQLSAVCRVRKVTRVTVYSPNEERRSRFALEMTDVCQCDVVPVPRPELAALDKDIVITATASRTPVLLGEWLSEGMHLNVIGSNFLANAEIDAAVVRRCDTLVVDSKEQAKLEAGDFAEAIASGIIHWSDVRELGQVMVGRQTGRARAEDVTMFKSVGLAVEDVAVAAQVYAKARDAGIGRMMEW
ncbi:MAG: ornithine cyclodeaminase family protein [Gemmataceae bacterium]|nr:ornithine cyclodeaminase family protein [Gemmataceae bacterium]